MAKKKIIRRNNRPLNIFAYGGPTGSITPSTNLNNITQLGQGGASGSVGMQPTNIPNSGGGGFNLGSIGQVGGAVGSIIQAGTSNAQIADTSAQEAQIQSQKNTTVDSTTNDDLMKQWGSWYGIKDDYSWREVRGGSTGQRITNTVGAVGSGAAAGASVGGPVGAIVGGVVGLGSSLAGWFTGNRKAKKKARKLNKQARKANDTALATFTNAANNIDFQNDYNMMANYAAYGGYLPMFGGQALNYELANKDLNTKELNAISKFRLTSLPNSFGAMPEFEDMNTFAEGGGIHIKKKNRGKFTSYCGGKVTSACIQKGLHSSNPTTRKRANFARNARKWHDEGGYLLAKGGGIHIKPQNRGKFTEYCGGKVTSECIQRGKNSSDPAVRKRAVFAQNARGWKHADGGYMGMNFKDNEAPAGLYQGAYDSISNYPNSFTNGGVFTDGVTVVGNGGSHEENPLNGVPMGIAPDGQPNLVEQGEVVFNDYVFSNRLHADGGLLEAYNLPSKYKDHTFASIAENINKEPSERPNDPISKRGLLANMSKLMQAQEDIKARKETRNNGRQYATGGPYKTYKNYTNINNDWYTDDYMNFVNSLQEGDPDSLNWLGRINSGEFGPIGGNTFTDVSDIKRLATDRKKGPVHNAMSAASKAYAGQPNLDFIEDEPYELPTTPEDIVLPTPTQQPNSVGLQRADNTGGANLPPEGNNRGRGYNFDPTWLRYAPALGAGIGVISDLFGANDPDYGNADLVMRAAGDMPSVSAQPIGNYLAYRPFDRDYYINKLNANAGASRRAIQNNSGGNRANAMAGILASDYSYGNSLGDLARQAEEYNLAQRERVEGFNRGTNQFNSEQALKAAGMNQQNRESQIRAIMAAAQMREDAAARSGAIRSANLTNFFDSLGDIGREEFSRNLINSNPALNYSLTGSGKVKYKSKKKR